MGVISGRNPGVTHGDNVVRERKNKQVRVRLVPTHLGHPLLLRFTYEEWEAVQAKAKELDVRISTLVRGLGVAVAKSHHDRANREIAADLRVGQVIEWAAADARMGSNEWLRVVTLSAIGYTKLAEQLAGAAEALCDGGLFKTAEGDEDEED